MLGKGLCPLLLVVGDGWYVDEFHSVCINSDSSDNSDKYVDRKVGR
jgi:hypothetical protein